MVRLGVGLVSLCLSACVTASIQPRWNDQGDAATGTTGSQVIEGCDYWVNGIGGDDSCEVIEAYFGITEKQFLSWNPSVPFSCTLVRGWSYCVAGPDDPIISSATTATPTLSSTQTSSETAWPFQSGFSASCSGLYLVGAYDTCSSIQDRFKNFTLEQFYSWNPSISPGCKGLEPGYYVCIRDALATKTAVLSSSSPTSSGAPTTAASHPHQSGTTSDGTRCLNSPALGLWAPVLLILAI